ncbi:MAG: hypothetical protein ACI8QF_002887 [Limisphaerales bacterium]
MLNFADPRVIELLKTQFVPIALDINARTKQKDAEGRFYWKIVEQSPIDVNAGTTQGHYIAAPDGEYLGFCASRQLTSRELVQALESALDKYKPSRVSAIPVGIPDRFNLNLTPPIGGAVVRVGSKILGDTVEQAGKVRSLEKNFHELVREQVGRDVLWVRADEKRALQRGQFPNSLLTRIVRFHLTASSHANIESWKPEHVVRADSTFVDGKLQASIILSTESKRRSYSADLIGYVEFEGNRITRFDLVAKGVFVSPGQAYKLRTFHKLPPGEFPLVIAFTLATGEDPSDRIPPYFLRSWQADYLK